VWKKTHFSPSWLWKVGVSVNLCPTSRCTSRPDTSPETAQLAGDELENESGDWTNNDDFTYGAKPPGRFFEGGRVMTVVHTNGIHYVPFHFCSCDNHKPEDQQLLHFRFYPSTFKHPRTVFTFGLLQDYSMEILECFTSTYHYYAKLRRITNHSFPRSVPVSIRDENAREGC
jgi:CxC2 like cysteine cluster associated with KDZ transposases